MFINLCLPLWVSTTLGFTEAADFFPNPLLYKVALSSPFFKDTIMHLLSIDPPQIIILGGGGRGILPSNFSSFLSICFQPVERSVFTLPRLLYIPFFGTLTRQPFFPLPQRGAIEIFLGNSSFAMLLIAMLFYWTETAFYKGKDKKVCSNALALSLTELEETTASKSNIIMTPFLRRQKGVEKEGGTICMAIASILLIVLLALRWQDSGHFPLSNLYESLMFLCWRCTFIQFLIINFLKSKDFLIAKLIGCITSPCALLTNAYASFCLPKDMQNASPLVPALQSNWLMMHVTVMILSYAALIVGSLLAIAFLLVSKRSTMSNLPSSVSHPPKIIIGGEEAPLIKKRGVQHSVQKRSTSLNLANALQPYNFAFPSELPLFPLGKKNLFSQEKEGKKGKVREEEGFPLTGDGQEKQKLANSLDNLSYRILGVGFPLLTIGILSGAVWANEAWGSYWSWDPKETWALLTWLVFAIYLHTRLTKGWEGRKPAIIASFGFITVWICYLGVNLLGEGLHSYGWLSN